MTSQPPAPQEDRVFLRRWRSRTDNTQAEIWQFATPSGPSYEAIVLRDDLVIDSHKLPSVKELLDWVELKYGTH